MSFDLKEFRSRKFYALVGSVVVLFTGWCLAAHWAALAPMFSTFVNGLVLLACGYWGSNVAHHFAENKAPDLHHD